MGLMAGAGAVGGGSPDESSAYLEVHLTS
jgi:hypothetical protein